MKPHDQWNSTDIAQYGRMSMHVTDYSEPTPRPITYGTRGLLGLCLVMIAALMVAFVYAAWRAW